MVKETNISVNEILTTIAVLKNDLAKDLYSDSQSMKLYNSLSKFEQSVYRFERFSSTGMEQEAAFEVGDLEMTIEDIIQFSKFRVETVDVSKFKLKPKRKRTIYIWKTEPGACDDCKSLDGTEYERREDVPSNLVFAACRLLPLTIDTQSIVRQSSSRARDSSFAFFDCFCRKLCFRAKCPYSAPLNPR